MVKKFIEKYKNVNEEVKAASIYTICSIIQKSLLFITTPLFTRLLTTEQYGQVTIYNSWSNFLTLFLTLYLAYGSFSTAMAKFEDQRGKYVASINGLCTVLTIGFLALYLPLQNVFNRVFELPTMIVLVMVASILFSNATQIWFEKERFENGHKRVAMTTLLTTIFSPIISLIFVLLVEEKGYARIVGGATVKILIGLVCYFYFFLKEKTFFDKKFWKYALGFNIPLIPYYLSQSIFNQSDKIMISHMQGVDKAAIYGVAYSLGLIMTFVLNSINNAYTPWFYKRIKEGDLYKNQKVSVGIALIMASLLLGVIVAAPEIIYIMASEKYMDAIWVVPPVAMSMLLLFYTQLFVNVEFYYEEKKNLVFGTIFSAIINIVLNYLLIPIFGFVAAAYTTLISYFLFVLLHYKMYKKILLKYELKDELFDYKTLIIIAGVFMGSGFLMMFLYRTFLIRYAIIGIAFVIILVRRADIVGFVKKLKSDK